MPRKNETGYWIQRLGRTKFRDTAAERGLGTCVEAIGGVFEEAKPISVRITNELSDPEWLTLTPDGWVKVPGFRWVYGYADGVHHWSDHQRRKDERLRTALANCGIRCIGVDSPLLEQRQHHPYVSLQLLEFLASKEPVKQLYQ
jgi:hypothetical protein